jgi:hypothetical protein
MALDEDAHLDIDRIELVHVPERPTLTPVISSFSPPKGPLGVEVTIEGSGFAEPASRNLVFFGTAPAEVLSGSATALTVKAQGTGADLITVRVPGGRAVVSDTEFVFVGYPSELLILSGDSQTASVGSTLEPLAVRLVDKAGNGVGGLAATFEVTAGTGVLSADEVTTDDDGVAQTTLTLGPTPGAVEVTAEVSGLSAVVFRATARRSGAQ